MELIEYEVALMNACEAMMDTWLDKLLAFFTVKKGGGSCRS
jgi:hypothetical protein